MADWLNAFVALAALAVSFLTARTAHRMNQRAMHLAEAQGDLAHQTWADEYFRDITAWAVNVTRTIAKAIYLSDDDETFRKQRSSILSELSVSLDTGRWYFPNKLEETYGTDKPIAYRGIRQDILDWVFEAHEIVNDSGSEYAARERLVECQRQFVSCMQGMLDPRSRSKIMRRVWLQFAPGERLRNQSVARSDDEE